MEKEDFEFYTMIEPHKDCWFRISGGTQKELTEKYMVDELEKRLEYDKENTDLPDKLDYKRINEFVMDVNERVVVGI